MCCWLVCVRHFTMTRSRCCCAQQGNTTAHNRVMPYMSCAATLKTRAASQRSCANDGRMQMCNFNTLLNASPALKIDPHALPMRKHIGTHTHVSCSWYIFISLLPTPLYLTHTIYTNNNTHTHTLSPLSPSCVSSLPSSPPSSSPPPTPPPSLNSSPPRTSST